MECYEVALEHRSGPSLFALSRGNLPTLRRDAAENRSARGGYVLAEAGGERRVSILATGSEVEIALAARDLLKQEGVAAAVVSMPCWQLFDRQDAAYRNSVLGGEAIVKVAVEAASTFGWERYVGPNGATIGLPGFGASGTPAQLYAHFGITREAVAQAALARLPR
jgi:transketolase